MDHAHEVHRRLSKEHNEVDRPSGANFLGRLTMSDAHQVFEHGDLPPTVLEDIHPKRAEDTTRGRTRLW